MVVSTPLALVEGTDFSVSNSHVTLTGPIAASLGQLVKVVVNYALQARTYVGGEPVFEAVFNPVLGQFELDDVVYAGGEKTFDLFTGQPVQNPFGTPQTHAGIGGPIQPRTALSPELVRV